MKKVLSFLASRLFLALMTLIVVGLVVWFVGPLIAFGALRPLAGAGMRVLVIALLLSGLLLWLARKPISIVFVAVLCLLIWYAAPLLSFGNAQPLESAAARTIAIAVVLALFAIYGLYHAVRLMQSDATFLSRILTFGDRQEPSPAADALIEIGRMADAALDRLRSMRTGASVVGRLFQGKRYLYELPWYITLGSKGAGKTTAMLNAGLAFPGAEQIQQALVRVAGGDGTAQVDWWLTNDAVLIDTTGRYTRPGLTSGRRMDVVADAGKTASSPVSITSARAARKEDATSKRVDSDRDAQTVDVAEWHGFLALLRKHRPRAPINGALLTVDVAEIIGPDAPTRAAAAAALSARLAELRGDLGIRFPVYLIVTRMDALTGFAEYFDSLTAEGRSQAWGMTLPHDVRATAKEGLRERCQTELGLLAARLADGVNTRLQDEYDEARRRKLVALHEEFALLLQPLGALIECVFLDSRYDSTQRDASLRGVYFTSARQDNHTIAADRHTVVQQLWTELKRVPSVTTDDTVSHQSYFLQDVLTRVVFPEAHLVRPNLHWEFRFRLLRTVAHALLLVLFAWLATGVWTSLGHNREYLDSIGHKTQALAARVTQLYASPKPEAVPDTLTDAQYLAAYPGLDLSEPDSAYRYGLYMARDVAVESRHTYNALEDNLLLPQIVRRMESVLSEAIAGKDAQIAYDTLRAYLMLQDRARYNADEVKAWVLNDWSRTDSAAAFGGRASMIEHVQQLFSGERVVQSPFVRNEALVGQARAFLDSNNATQRLYDRAKAAMRKEAPQEFTLLRAVGPQAGTVFTRVSGEPLTRGVPGLFTYDGYRNLFDKRLPEFARKARDDDAWVMGRSLLGDAQHDAQKKTAEIVNRAEPGDDPLTGEIRRQYLLEYAQQWDAFLGDIRPVTGTSLAFNLQVLRRFAAPDSPLARLARAAVKETTLTAPDTDGDPSFLQKAAGRLAQKTEPALGIRAEERLERELVDGHFAALREVVTGAGDTLAATQTGGQSAAQGGALQLDSLASQLNNYYTVLTVADNALTNNSMPPASDAAVRLKLSADTLPAPLREVLRDLAVQGSFEVNQGIGQLLSRQMVATLGDACRLTVEGNYPFSPEGKQDVSIDDFNRVFAQGGVLDDFFAKTLAPFVDTSAKPWRYRTLPGATEPVQGPALQSFERAKAIRDVFFTESGQKKLSWKADIRIAELDPVITGLALDIDGQGMQYQHGPVRAFPVTWPGPQGGAHAEITANPRIRPETSTLSVDGPWALMRLLKKGTLIDTATPGRTRVEFDFDGRKAVLDIAGAGSVANPLTSDVLSSFHCPSSMPTFSLNDSGPPTGLPMGSPFARAE
jgi:type VI secretion system protein ImpL